MMARRVIAGRGGFSPKALFANGEQGVWYDPSDFSTLFQDAAGTTPVTAVDQYVGKILDKSGRGNHATQSNSDRRPQIKLANGKYYLLFDGTDDHLVTPSIDFSATNKMTVFGGARKLSDSNGYQILCELSTNAGTNNGTFLVDSNILYRDPDEALAYCSKGSTNLIRVAALLSSYPTPSTYVFTGISQITTSYTSLRINGILIGSNTGNQGTGNYGNHPLCIFSRGGYFSFLNGHLYSLIVRGAQTPANLIAATERYVARKTGVTL